MEDGDGYAGKYLHGITPDLILVGFSWAIENPGPLIERYIAASDDLRAALADLTTEKDYRLWFDLTRFAKPSGRRQAPAEPFPTSVASGLGQIPTPTPAAQA